MTKHKLQARLGATAIAAALALSSTPLLAQQTTPDTTQTAPSTAPATDSAPATDTVPTVAVPAVTTTSDTSAPATTSATTTTRTTVHHTVASTARPAAARTVATHHVAAAAPVAAAPVATPVATVPATTTAPAPPAGPPPLAQIAGPPPAAANNNQQNQSDRTSEIVGAAIFALIVLGAIAYALSRRRRTRETVYEEQAYEPEASYEEAEPVHARAPIAEEQPAIVAPETSAFAWGNRPQAGTLETPAAVQTEADEPMTLPSGFDLSRFGPHVRAAYRGPTPDNPSLSLRNRLRRAAAMDQKERAMGREASCAPMNGETVTEHRELADA